MLKSWNAKFAPYPGRIVKFGVPAVETIYDVFPGRATTQSVNGFGIWSIPRDVPASAAFNIAVPVFDWNAMDISVVEMLIA
jgi:hypothetical protein